jgi:hypothetical protein
MEDGSPSSRYGEVVGPPGVAELLVVPGVVDVGAGVRVVVARAAEVVGAPDVPVVSGAEVAVEVGDVVVGPDAVGGGAWAGREPPELLTVPAGGGRTSRYSASTATKSRESSRVEVRSLPFSNVAGNRPAITHPRCPAHRSGPPG